jgi:hemoglobin-like flavoprotein
MDTDAALMEASLLAAADTGADIRTGAFDRFFAAFPDRREIFYNYDAATPRMTNETIEMMFGLATDEKWVWYQIAALIFNHRNYGVLPQTEYDAFVDFSVDALGEAAGPAWTPECAKAWRRQAARLKAMIADAL